ncbi:hypothetical protein [Halobacillus yeomjeoni]|uniref:Uncharacterized protein n=1 Tax=Halobacillus yeomjeoni TaxID=311194 RepID=A0A931HT93_9BACI|nr:hypothetical protein [Halobacillus yeomjeoni]MBH0229207.1 hypothetical protein [Halobacillus yeomjeoni]
MNKTESLKEINRLLAIHNEIETLESNIPSAYKRNFEPMYYANYKNAKDEIERLGLQDEIDFHVYDKPKENSPKLIGAILTAVYIGFGFIKGGLWPWLMVPTGICFFFPIVHEIVDSLNLKNARDHRRYTEKKESEYVKQAHKLIQKDIQKDYNSSLAQKKEAAEKYAPLIGRLEVKRHFTSIPPEYNSKESLLRLKGHLEGFRADTLKEAFNLEWMHQQNMNVQQSYQQKYDDLEEAMESKLSDMESDFENEVSSMESDFESYKRSVDSHTDRMEEKMRDMEQELYDRKQPKFW